MQKYEFRLGSWIQILGWLWLSFGSTAVLLIFALIQPDSLIVPGLAFFVSSEIGVFTVMLGFRANRIIDKRTYSLTEALFESGYSFRYIISLVKKFTPPQLIICSSVLFIVPTVIFQDTKWIAFSFFSYLAAFIIVAVKITIRVIKWAKKKKAEKPPKSHAVSSVPSKSPAASISTGNNLPHHSHISEAASTFICSVCNREFTSNESIDYNKVLMCNDCYKITKLEEQSRCAACEKALSQDDLIFIDNNYYCMDCVLSMMNKG